MMSLVSLVLFGAAVAMIAWVVGYTLLPAMPRMVALLSPAVSDAEAETIYVTRPVVRQPALVLARAGG